MSFVHSFYLQLKFFYVKFFLQNTVQTNMSSHNFVRKKSE